MNPRAEHRRLRDVLNCASPLALSSGGDALGALEVLAGFQPAGPVEPKSGGGPPQSKSFATFGRLEPSASVVDCASPLALSNA